MEQTTSNIHCYSNFDFFNTNSIKFADENYINNSDCKYIYNESEQMLSLKNTTLNYKILNNKLGLIFNHKINLIDYSTDVYIFFIKDKIYKALVLQLDKENNSKNYLSSLEIINKNGDCEFFQFSESGFKIEGLEDLILKLSTFPTLSFESMSYCEYYYTYRLIFHQNKVEKVGKIHDKDYENNEKIEIRDYHKFYQTDNNKYNLTSWICSTDKLVLISK